MQAPTFITIFLSVFLPVAGWILLSFAVRDFWGRKGLERRTGLLVSILLSPLIGFVLGLVLTPDAARVEAARLAAGQAKKCPYCAELVKAEAIVCRFCGRELTAKPTD